MLNKYSTTVSLGRNRYQTTIGLKQINFYNGHAWQLNSDTWIDSGIPARPHMIRDAPFMISVTPDGLRRIHPTREDNVWFEISGAKINQAGTWNVVQLGTPTSRVNNRITWNRTNFNAYVDMAGHYVKLAYLLKNGYLPPNNQFAYEVATNGLTRQGTTLLKDDVPVMHMRAPIAYDHDNPDDVRQIAHEITRIDGKWHVVFTLPDLTGMSKPVIDPTLELQPDAAAGKDTLISGLSDRVNNNYGANPNAFQIGKANATWLARSLWFMSLSSISASATCDSSTITLTNNGDVAQTASITMKMHCIKAANSGWIEGTADNTPQANSCCWNDHTYQNVQEWAGSIGLGTPGTDYNASELASHVIGDDVAGTTYNITLNTTQVQAWFGSDDDNHGVFQKASVEDTIGVYAEIAGSDHATPSYRPKLVTVWTAGDARKDTTPQFFPILFDKKKHQ
jgi:hypothetical protein